MKSIKVMIMACGIAMAAGSAAADTSTEAPPVGKDPEARSPAPTSEERAEKRYQEMLGRMQASIEEIAQLYGNPMFLQVFTNDIERANQLKQRLHAAKRDDEIAKETQVLDRRRSELEDDIALKERESARLAKRLAAQRAALDAVAAAVELARRAVEDTSK